MIEIRGNVDTRLRKLAAGEFDAIVLAMAGLQRLGRAAELSEVKLSASSTETGESEDTIETSYQGEALTVGFNAQYILDFLKAVGAGDVKLELKDAQSAGQLRPAESEDYKYRYIVMPMRI